MRSLSILRVAPLFLFAAVGCDDGGSDTEVDTEADTTEFEPDTEADTEGDTEADTEADTEEDTEEDTEMDTEAPVTNLLNNAGFETGDFTDWFVFPPERTNFSITTTARTGTSAARLFAFDAPNAETPRYQENTSATPGDCYTMDAWVYHPSSEPLVNTEAMVFLKFFTSDFGGFAGTESLTIDSTTPTDEWVQYTATAAVPDGFAIAQAAIQLWECRGQAEGACGSSGAVYFDDVRWYLSPGACDVATR